MLVTQSDERVTRPSIRRYQILGYYNFDCEEIALSSGSRSGRHRIYTLFLLYDLRYPICVYEIVDFVEQRASGFNVVNLDA